MALSWSQVSYWENNEKLYKHAIEVTDKKYPSFAPIYSNLGAALVEQNKINEAIGHYKSGVKLKPDFVKAHYYLRTALSDKGEYDEAIIYFKEAVKYKPGGLMHEKMKLEHERGEMYKEAAMCEHKGHEVMHACMR
jgi:tetratricopeptide (TPR) repeat protein